MTDNKKSKKMSKKMETKDKMTLGEFKAWLAGANEWIGEDWVPDAAQWKMIRDKINNIEEPVMTQSAAIWGEQPTQPPVYAQPQLPANIPPAPPVPGGVPAGEVVHGTTLNTGEVPPPIPAAPTAMAHNAPGAPPGGVSSTPHIDSTGGYNSGFA